MKYDYFWRNTHEYDCCNTLRADSDWNEYESECYRYDLYRVNVVFDCLAYAKSKDSAIEAISEKLSYDKCDGMSYKIVCGEKVDAQTICSDEEVYLDDDVDQVHPKLFSTLWHRGFWFKEIFRNEYSLEQIKIVYELLREKCSCIWFIREHINKNTDFSKRVLKHFVVECGDCIRGNPGSGTPICKERLEPFTE